MTHRHPHPDGMHYPTDHVGGVLRTRTDAERAADALRAAGFDADDITLFHEPGDLAAMRKRETFLSALSSAFEPVAEDGGGWHCYLDALTSGRSVLLVYTPDQQAVERACDVLTHHGAHNKQAFHRWTIESLPESAPEHAETGR
jgi:hypothetical protein